MDANTPLFADDSESSLSEYSEDDQGQLRKRNTRGQSATAHNAGSSTVSESKTTASKKLGDLKAAIYRLLDVDTRKVFSKRVNQIVSFGNKNPTTLGQRREKLRETVARNEGIASLYNDYARQHAESEKRKPYQLPLFHEMSKRSADKSQHRSRTKSVEESPQPMAHEEERSSAPGSPSSPSVAPKITAVEKGCNEHSASNRRCAILPISNPEAFPVDKLQEVQAQYYPRARIIAMSSHRDANGIITHVTADVDQGSIDHLVITDPRVITALGVRSGSQDTISWDSSELKIDETFIIRMFPGQRPKSSKVWIVGELQSARHAYLYWLDLRRSADPETAPYVQEARVLATRLGRRAAHVFNEINNVWEKEQGPCGQRYRGNRMRYLGEDPCYSQEAWAQAVPVSMWD